MQPINDYGLLIKFVKEHKNNYKDLLKEKPYCVNVSQCEYNPNWFMFGYSQFESDFTNPIVRCSRGSVLEITDDYIKPISLPFYKFCNYGQEGEDEIDWDSATVQDKKDGNLIKIFKANGKVFSTTNKSFKIDMEVGAVPVCDEPLTRGCKTYKQILDRALSTQDDKWLKDLPDGITLMFELTGPMNRIINKFTTTKLWFLGARNNTTFLEYNRDEAKRIFNIPFDMPEVYDVHDIKKVKELLAKYNGENQEGIVVCDKDFRRIKIKSDAYLKLKFVKGEGNFSEKAIFKSIIDGSIDDASAAYPEIIPIVKKIEDKLEEYKKSCFEKVNEARKIYSKNKSKKEVVDWARTKNPDDFWIYMLCGKSDDQFVESSILNRVDFKDL